MPFDVNAYLAANPDLADNWNAGGVLTQLGGSLPEAAQAHYDRTGQAEIAAGGRGGGEGYAVPAPTPSDVNYAPPQVQTASADLAVPASVVPQSTDSGLYGASESGSNFKLPELTAANGQYATPYYSAYTNDNDFAGAVMAGDGQKIRLVDGKTGEVVFEGTGPDAARQATAIANAVSDDKGRKAAWAIQSDNNGQWTTQAAERYDPKKTGVWGTLLDIAAPIILNALLPGVGGALAGALGSTLGGAAFQGLANLGSGLVQGESLKNAGLGALTAGAGSAVIGGVLNRVPGANNAVNSVLRPVNYAVQDAVNAIPGLRAVLDPINNGLVHVIDGAGNVIHTMTGGIDAAKSWINGAVNSVTGGGGPNVTPFDPSALSPVTVTGNIPTSLGVPISPNLPSGGVTNFDPGAVSPVTVTARPPEDPGLPIGVDATGVTPTDLSGVTVTGQPPPTTGLPTPPITTVTPTDLTPVTVTAHPPTDPGPPVIVDPFPTDPLATPPTMVDNPFSVTPPGTPTPPPTTVFNPGSSLAGTRASLDPIFSRQLPTAPFGSKTPRNVQVDNRYAIAHPEASFFSSVPQRASNFTVPSPQDILLAALGGEDPAAFRKRFRGYAKGGVAGKGDGRSDSIPAVLSDGEYVVDAETVALLGNGSNKAGAKAMDRFRVNIRKHKGAGLAKGRFSVAAKAPDAYLKGHA